MNLDDEEILGSRGDGIIKNLTVQEKVILHLFRLRAFNDAFEVPVSMCQAGIAKDVGIRRSHASSVLKGLREKGKVDERMAHIRSGKRRRKVYQLTFNGKADGSRFYEGLERAGIPLEKVLTKVPEEDEMSKSFTMVPEIRYFFGRQKELGLFERWLLSMKARALVVKGIPGIGKTTFLSKAVQMIDERSGRRIFWYTIKEWSGLSSILVDLSAFISELGIGSLSRSIKHDDLSPLDLDMTVMSLLEAGDLLIVLDDIHHADDRTVQFLKALIQIGTHSGLKIAMAGRSIPHFFSRRDAKVKGNVNEIEIDGLGPKDGKLLYEAVVDKDDFERVYSLSKGHPLSIELMGLTEGSTVDSTRFIFEEIYRFLSQEEKVALTAASVYREPVPIEAIFIDDGITFKAIDDISHRGLIRTRGGRSKVHSLVRAFFYDRLSPKDKERLHSRASRFYLEEGSDRSWLEAHYHMILSGDPKRSAQLIMTRASELLRKGYHQEILRIAIELEGKEISRTKLDILKIKAEVLNMYGLYEDARHTCERILELSEKYDDPTSRTQGHILLGVLAYNQEEWEHAIESYNSALAVAIEVKDKENMAKVYNNLGILHWKRSDNKRAVECYTRSLEMAEEMEDGPGIARIKANLGIIFWQDGDIKSAMTSYMSALSISEDLGDMKTVSILHGNIGELQMDLDDEVEAKRSFEMSLELAKKVGFKQQVQEAQRHLATLEVKKC